MPKALLLHNQITKSEYNKYISHSIRQSAITKSAERKRKSFSDALNLIKHKVKKWDDAIAAKFIDEVSADQLSEKTAAKFLTMSGIGTGIILDELRREGIYCLHIFIYQNPVMRKLLKIESNFLKPDNKNGITLALDVGRWTFKNVHYRGIDLFCKFKRIQSASVVLDARKGKNPVLNFICKTDSGEEIVYRIKLDKNYRPIGMDASAKNIAFARILLLQGQIDNKTYKAYFKECFRYRDERKKESSVKQAMAILKSRNLSRWDEPVALKLIDEIKSNKISEETVSKFLWMVNITKINDLKKKDISCLYYILHDAISEYGLLNYNKQRYRPGRYRSSFYDQHRKWEVGKVKYTHRYSFFQFMGVAPEVVAYIDKKEKNKRIEIYEWDNDKQDTGKLLFAIKLNSKTRPVGLEDDKKEVMFAEILQRQGQITPGQLSDYLYYIGKFIDAVFDKDKSKYYLGNISYNGIDAFLKFKEAEKATIKCHIDSKGKKYFKLEYKRGSKNVCYAVELDNDLKPVGIELAKGKKDIAFIDVLHKQGRITAQEHEEIKEHTENWRVKNSIATRKIISSRKLRQAVYSLKPKSVYWDDAVADKFLQEAETNTLSAKTVVAFFKIAGITRISDLQKPGLWGIYNRTAKIARENDILSYGTARSWPRRGYQPPPVLEFLFDLLPTQDNPLPDDRAIKALYRKAVKDDAQAYDELANQLMRFTAQAFMEILERRDPDIDLDSELLADRFSAACEAVLDVIAKNPKDIKKCLSLYDYFKEVIIEEAVVKEKKAQRAPKYSEIPAEDVKGKRKSVKEDEGRKTPFLERIPDTTESGVPITPLNFLDTTAPISEPAYYNPDDIIPNNDKAILAAHLRDFLTQHKITDQLQQALNGANYAIYIVGSLGTHGIALKDDANLNLIIVIDESYTGSLAKVSKILREHFNGQLLQRNTLLSIGQHGTYHDELVNGNGFISFLLNHRIGSPRSGFATIEVVSTNGSSSPHQKARALLHTTVPLNGTNAPNAILVYESRKGIYLQLQKQLKTVLETSPNIAYSQMADTLSTFKRKQEDKDHGDSITDPEEHSLTRALTIEQTLKNETEDPESDFAQAMLEEEPEERGAVAVKVMPPKLKARISMETAALRPMAAKIRLDLRLALDPGNPGFDVVKWYNDFYEKKLAELDRKWQRQELTAQDLLDFVRTVIMPIKPDFNLKGIITPDTAIEPYRIRWFGNEILEQVLIPYGLIAEGSSFGEGTCVGRIIPERTEYRITPAGRRIPIYTVITIEGTFGAGVAHANYIVLSTEGENHQRNIATEMRRLWSEYKEDRNAIPSMEESLIQFFVIWTGMHFLGRHDFNHAMTLLREGDIAEEIAHSDMHFFAERFLGPKKYLSGSGYSPQIAESILKPQSILLRQFINAGNKPGEQADFAEVIVELEAMLASIMHSPYPAWTFIQNLFAGVLDTTTQASEPSRYPRTRNFMLLMLGKELMGEARLGLNRDTWVNFLLRYIRNLDNLNSIIKKAAGKAYNLQFLTSQERARILQQAKTGPDTCYIDRETLLAIQEAA